MTADRDLTPADAVVALRSFPRRFRSALARPDDDDFDPDEVARRYGSDGSSAAEHVLAAVTVLDLLAEAVRQVPHPDQASVPDAFTDLGTVAHRDDHSPVAALLARVEASAEAAVARIDSIGTDQWANELGIAGTDQTLGALTLVQDAIGAVAARLRATERTVSEVT